ncbi:MAG: tetraacyldisaccharide 4'-kinase [Acidobacteriota bacterium]|jgi:tetraacyldisaccharide 4'-kinase
MGDGRNLSPWTLPLLPAGWLYCKLNDLRADLYRMGRLKSLPLDRPVLSIGNLTFGGTGKTPVTLHVAKILLSKGKKPAILLRGYGRETTGPRLVESSSAPIDVGEEALLFARELPPGSVAVSERRELGARMLPSPPDLYLLDDGFQHLRIHRDADIVLVDALRLRDLRPAPAGRLRESPKAALKRADLLLVTRGTPADLSGTLRRAWGERPLASVHFEWEEELLPSGTGTLTSLKASRICAFAGIGNPHAFFEQARGKGLTLLETAVFPDHAYPTPGRLRQILEIARRRFCEVILTTEKDWIKWAPAWKGPVPLAAVRQTTCIEDPDGALDRILNSLIGRET